MIKNAPPLQHMLEALIAAPSISSVTPELDQGNEAVIHLLTDWLDASGPEPAGWSSPAIPTRSPVIRSAGTTIPSGLPRTAAGSMGSGRPT
jgi:acetylornithine deacetylase